jgi:hypothetical protein
MKTIPTMPSMCATCPFRPGSPHAALQNHLAESALNEASRICHSTGQSVFYGRTGKKPRLCRGARDLQLKVFAAIGVIESATDEAWAKKWAGVKKRKPAKIAASRLCTRLWNGP